MDFGALSENVRGRGGEGGLRQLPSIELDGFRATTPGPPSALAGPIRVVHGVAQLGTRVRGPARADPSLNWARAGKTTSDG